MALVTDAVAVSTRGDSQMLDLTPGVQDLVTRHRFREGQALVFVPGSTAGLTTVEFEPGLQRDLPAAFERIAPRGVGYAHEATWHDDNGHSHVRASLLGPSLTVPFRQGRLLLGTWQQIVLIDFDTRPRQREVVVQLSGSRAQTA
ncbi:MAG TPA: secondary thiamine-phosphate synthase enzyme YjbQ [Vicinamibacteria bacterium]|nr:secondary thiamine-phosphate synthase enzyme YjbQ [Vicinamibacteria bacterium]